jgi:hypothetical protein
MTAPPDERLMGDAGTAYTAGERHRHEERDSTRDSTRTGQSLTDLLQKLLRDANTLVRDEVELVRAETRESIAHARSSINEYVTAAIFFLIGGLALTAALIIGLAEFVDEWVAALIVGIVALLIGLALKSRANSHLSAQRLKPDRTTASLRRDRQMLKETLS